ncbi:RICIN domain-containing protein [Dactylosporangium sp. AC04546]|uniref:RICIN domain-containing protein n=1 Tax=Dactylosporangium sp. AC04546 TaxID=2862460 RepID=UPI001EDF6EB4|nr:RICIN domain-containing protein [Dactylosporangium sp. AC04546]WVK81528.1 RICIN domain-containing protein [Dactylosporangium sp. AC04546]
MMRRLLACLALLVPLAVAVQAPSAGASTFAPANGRLLFVGQSTKAAWDDYTSFAEPPSGGSVYYEVKSGTWVNPDGATVQLWDCLGNGAQRWTVQANGNLVNPQSGRRLDASGWGTGNGTRVQLWTCGPGPQSNQAWTIR